MAQARWEDELVERGLQCAVCIDFLCAPLTLGCGHTFCRLCLVQAAQLAPSGQQCPTCRGPVELQDPASHAVDRAVAAQVKALVPQQALAAREEADAQKLRELLARPRHRLPIFYMRGAASRPGQTVSLHLFEPRYKVLARRAAAGNRLFVCMQQVPTTGAEGLLVRIEQVAFEDDGRANLLGRGVAVVSLQNVAMEKGTDGLYCADVGGAEDLGPAPGAEALEEGPGSHLGAGLMQELPVFYMSRGTSVGETVLLKLFEPRYRALARQAWTSRRLFAFAAGLPRVGDPAVLVRMQSCRWDSEGNAHVVGIGLATAQLEAVREDVGQGRLFFARCRLPADEVVAEGSHDVAPLRRTVQVAGANACCTLQ